MQTKDIPYKDEQTELEGFAAFPTNEKRPCVILCHAWRGRDDFVCEKAQLMAEWGYVGFALDVYGKGVLGQSKEENARLKKPFLEDRALLQRRLLKGIETVRALPYVDTSKMVAIGFGFGGLCALDLARSGLDLKGAVSLYGHFDPPNNFQAQPIKSKILILHGAKDRVVSLQDLINFGNSLTETGVDWQAHLYGEAMHAFSTPTANDPAAGIAFHPQSSQRAWLTIQNFLTEVFKEIKT